MCPRREDARYSPVFRSCPCRWSCPCAAAHGAAGSLLFYVNQAVYPGSGSVHQDGDFAQ